jgi:catechol 2,3-dioxygenase-like lactoylglutathione lyase family enzyme
MTLPVDQLYRTTVVVRDLGAAAREYAEFYGITRWDIALQSGFVAASGANTSGGLCFRLVEPTATSDSIFGEFLLEHGEGIQSICLTRVSPAELADLQAWFESLGAGLAATMTAGKDLEEVQFDTRALLGGFMLEVIASAQENWQESLGVDDTWDLGDVVARPRSLDFVKDTPGLNHFGVVVPDLQAVLTNYVRVFGLRRWRGYHWHTGEGSLEEPTYMGESAEHGFSTARGDIGLDRFGHGFGFEIVQPDFGPSHFADFKAQRGSGIHHLSLNLRMKDALEWVEFQGRMETLGPVCMSGWLRDHSAKYIYSDLSARLGHVVESGIRRRSGHEPDRWYEFNENGSLLP